MYGASNIDDTTINGLYVIQFISEAYKLQKNTKLMDKLFLLVNYFLRHNIFAPSNKTPIGIGNNSHCNILA